MGQASSPFASQAGFDVTGLDLSAGYVEDCRKAASAKQKGDFIEGSYAGFIKAGK